MVDWTATDRVHTAVSPGRILFERAPRGYFEGAQGSRVTRAELRSRDVDFDWMPLRQYPQGKWTRRVVALWLAAPLFAIPATILWAGPTRAAWRRQVGRWSQAGDVSDTRWRPSRRLALRATQVSALILLLCVGMFLVSLLWNWHMRVVSTNFWHEGGVRLRRGGVEVWWSGLTSSAGQRTSGWFVSQRLPQFWIGLPYVTWESGLLTGRSGAVGCPFWLPALPLGVFTVFLAQIYIASTKRDNCSRCHYPRTGLAPAAPCPECGTPVQPSPQDVVIDGASEIAAPQASRERSD